MRSHLAPLFVDYYRTLPAPHAPPPPRLRHEVRRRRRRRRGLRRGREPIDAEHLGAKGAAIERAGCQGGSWGSFGGSGSDLRSTRERPTLESAPQTPGRKGHAAERSLSAAINTVCSAARIHPADQIHPTRLILEPGAPAPRLSYSQGAGGPAEAGPCGEGGRQPDIASKSLRMY